MLYLCPDFGEWFSHKDNLVADITTTNNFILTKNEKDFFSRSNRMHDNGELYK